MENKKLANLTHIRDFNKSPLINEKKHLFKIAICEPLDNGYCFKKLCKNSSKELQNFIDETIGKSLTVTKVDKLYLRKKGEVKREINGRELIHYGKDRKKFRIFGYYNNDGYFVVVRIDPNHRTDKS